MAKKGFLAPFCPLVGLWFALYRGFSERFVGTYSEDAIGHTRGLLKQLLLRYGDTEVIVGAARGDPAAVGALYQAALQEVRFVDVLDRIACLT